MIFTENLTKNYGELPALKSLDLSIAEGEIFGLIGPNGAGKSTTLKILATLLRPSSGRAMIGGKDVAANGSVVRRMIGYMPDFAGVYRDMQVDEYLYFFAAAAGITGSRAKSILADVLELTDLGDKREVLVETLSRGMQQRLGIARVLLHDPKVLLLDEPASGLDPRARIEMRMLLRELRSMNKTVIISSHILSELAEVCTSVGIIESGKLVYQGGIDELMERCRRGNVVHLRVGSPLPDPDDDEARIPVEMMQARELLIEDSRVVSAELAGESLEVVVVSHSDRSFVSQLLVEQGFHLHYFSEEPLTLEDAFMRLTDGVVS